MKQSILKYQTERIISLAKKAGRAGVALLLAVTMICAALPSGGDAYLAFAGEDIVSGSDSPSEVQAETQVAEPDADEVKDAPIVSDADAKTEEQENIQENINVVLPLSSQSDIAVSAADAEKHICTVHGFEDHVPGKPICSVEISESQLAGAQDLLPETLTGIMGCEECSDKVKIEWRKNAEAPEDGIFVYYAILDGELYSYVVLDDPDTEDINESNTSPYCDLPFAEVIVKAEEEAVSDADVASDTDAAVSDTDIISDSDVVSDTDIAVSGTDVVSESDAVSGTDIAVSGSDVKEDADKPEDGNKDNSETVSDTDIGNGESQVLPLCTCDSHCYADLEAGLYLVDIGCPACSIDPSSCLIAPELVESTLEITAEDGRTVTVKGQLPEGAVLSAELVSEEEAAELLGDAIDAEKQEIFFAYDIKILFEGCVFQPGDYGMNVEVSISNVEAGCSANMEVYHIAEEGPQIVDASLSSDFVATFETNGFSVYVGTTTHERLTDIYVWRDGGSGINDHFFSTDPNNLSGSKILKSSNGEAYHNMQEVIEDCCPVGGNLTIHIKATYCSHGTQTIDGTGRNVTIKHYPDHKRNMLHVIDGTLTLKNVTINSSTTTKIEQVTDAIVLVNSGASLVMEDGARLVGGGTTSNGNYHAVYLDGSNASFTMNGGEISENHASGAINKANSITTDATSDANGAAVYIEPGAKFTMNGGKIVNNTAKDSGGAIWNQGTMIMNGGVISGNTASRLNGGAIYCCGKGETHICGGEISGNHSGSAGNDGDGICVSQSTSDAPHLLMTGSPLITDIVSLGFVDNDVSNRDISVYGDFNPRSIINITLRSPGSLGSGMYGKEVVSTLESYTNSGSYKTRKATAEDLAKFAMVDPALCLYIDPSVAYQLKLGKSPVSAYYSMNGTGDGSTPDKPTSSMEAAYALLKQKNGNKGGVIYMLTDYTPKSDVIMDGSSITVGGKTTDAGGPVTIKRYSKQSGYNAASNTTKSMITVNEGITVTLGNILIDGHNRKLNSAISGSHTAGAILEASNPSIHVNGGTLNINSGTRIKDAPANPLGGAVYVLGGGTVNVSGDVMFDNNLGAVGKNIYVASDTATVNLSGKITMGKGDIHLSTAGSKVNIDGGTFIDENGKNLLDITLSDTPALTGESGRVVAEYISGTPSLAQLGVSNSLVSEFYTEASGKNVILLAPDSATLTAAPDNVDMGERVKSVEIDLSEIFEEEILNANSSVDVSGTAESIELVNYATVDSNAGEWDASDASAKFGLDADGADVAAAASASYSATDRIVTVTLHNANAIVETKEGVGSVSLKLTIGGYVRTFDITIDTLGGAMCVTVPLKITGVVDATGEFYLPSPTAYAVENKSNFPVEISQIDWKWETGANDLFSNVSAMSSSVKLGDSSTQYEFKENSLTVSSITDGQIGALSKIGLAWDMVLGENNSIRAKTTRQVATITYTIEIAE